MWQILIKKYAKPQWRLIAQLVILSLAANALLILQPLLLAGVLSLIIGQLAGAGTSASIQGGWFNLNAVGQHLTQWWFSRLPDPVLGIAVLSAAFLLQSLLSAALNYAASLTASRIKIQSLQQLQSDVLQHLFRLNLQFFHKERMGELISRLTQDASNTAQGLGPLVQSIIHHSVQVLVCAAFLFGTNAWLTCGALAILALHFGLTHLLRHPLRRLAKGSLDAMADFTQALQETFTNIRAVKCFGAEAHQFDVVLRTIQSVGRAFFSKARVEKLEQPARAVLDTLAIVGILLIALLQLKAGRLTTEGLLLYLYVGRMITAPIGHMATNALWLQALLASYERIHELMLTPPRVMDGNIRPQTFGRSIEFREVYFSYGQNPILKDISLTIERGQTIALVGPSGAGKSTLADLLLRLYDPDRGVIQMDGVNLRAMDQTAYRNLFGVVTQEVLLFHDTVANNIRFGRRGISHEHLVAAAQAAHAESFIHRLPQGYDTVIGDRGIRLSGGERQRLAIARALAGDPPIVILDEATSELDSESERAVQEALNVLMKTKTTIIIAHRFATILRADVAIVIDHGNLLACGNHEELLVSCELYRRLYELQAMAGMTTEE
ncbi:MAG: ABC transporter ATP-binding protein [Candidatus Omnitrophica bacterium]|nr:ABC transporter ATP-binding protein [Candidatus Omnitrophota bacterium]MBI2173715.1 ABC transporter ATP-binding protein [Candidatus Omnitrophota bacterium]